MTDLNEYVAKRNVDRARVAEHKRRLIDEVRAYKLRELRQQAGLTQAQLAERIGVGQRQVSKIENGDIENAKVSTIRGYLESVGGQLSLEFVIGDQRFQVV